MIMSDSALPLMLGGWECQMVEAERGEGGGGKKGGGGDGIQGPEGEGLILECRFSPP